MMTQQETKRHDLITSYLNAKALLNDMEPSSPCWGTLCVKVTELEIEAISQAMPDTPDVDIPALEVPVADSRGSSSLFAIFIALGCFSWGYFFLTLAKR